MLKEPIEHPSLKFMYKKQPDILNAIVNEISDIQDGLNVSSCFFFEKKKKFCIRIIFVVKDRFVPVLTTMIYHRCFMSVYLPIWYNPSKTILLET